MQRFSVHALCFTSLTVLAAACGGDDKNDNTGGDSDTTPKDATQAQAVEAFGYFATSVQIAFAAGQANQTPTSGGFTFEAPATNCGLNGTYAITGTGTAGGTYAFTPTWTECATQTYAIDGTEDETATISQSTAGGNTLTDEEIHATSAQLGFATLSSSHLPSEEFNCGATDLNLHVQVNQPSGGAASQTVTGNGTWCGFTWDSSFVGSYQFVPQSN